MSTPIQILEFLRDAALIGAQTTLIILTGVEGASSRAPGTMMAVSDNGRWCGSLSSGCVEAALVGEAQRVIGTGCTERLRIGTGSPLIDIRLPCGGGMDLLMIPNPDTAVVGDAVAQLRARHAIALRCDDMGRLAIQMAAAECTTGWQDAEFVARLNPVLHMLVAGQGDEVRALTVLGLAYGAQVTAWTPENEQVAHLSDRGAESLWLKSAAHPPPMELDRYAAFISLFHDHDWEAPLIAQALGTDAFYIGAMGSRQTHANRLQVLRDAGVAEDRLERIIGPVGLLHASRDPAMLALSVLAQVAEFYRKL